ncbi:DUF2961 domain-containing protein [bacterium]|nr:MAG: DUF2961 domain-containing protein [bacterium]
MNTQFNGLGMHLGNLWRLSNAQTRSISAENPRGEKGGGGRAPVSENPCARDLGLGWKCRPCIPIKAGETVEIADIEGSGAIQQMWMTPTGAWRLCILRVYWDDQETPSIECPVGDFFACGWGGFDRGMLVNSLSVCVNPGSALNCFWEMPFRKRCRMTFTNLDVNEMTLFYQINYTLTDVPEDAAYFHAQFRRSYPLPYKKVHHLLDGVTGRGQYVGTYLAWGLANNRWWGEGEIKFYLDGDKKPGQSVAEETEDKENAAYPTICGTGTEDYFLGSYNFENQKTHQYQEFSTAYAGMPHMIRPDGLYQSQTRFSLYRWHLPDPIRFQEDISVTIQSLGWRSGGRFLAQQDDISSVAYWYQTLPSPAFPTLPDAEFLEII